MENDGHVCNNGNFLDEEFCESDDEYTEDYYFDPKESIFGSEAVQSSEQPSCYEKETEQNNRQ